MTDKAIQFLHAADIHLDSPLNGLERYEGAPVEQIRGATRRAFENLVELAVAEQVGFVVLAGDLYDGDWKDYNTGLFFISQMSRLRDEGIKVFVVAGNHDAASQITKALSPPDNVHIFDTRAPQTVTLEDFGIAIHGQGFPSRSVDVDLAAEYPLGDAALFNIGLLHTSLDGRPGHANYAPCSIDSLRSRGYQYWALGHVHQREVVAEDPWIVFPGNLQGRHAREIGPKGCSLVRVDEGNVLAVDHRPVDVVRWAVIPVDVSSVGSVDEAIGLAGELVRKEAASAEGQLLAARIRFVGVSPANSQLRALRSRVVNETRALAATTGDAVWIEKVEVETKSTQSRAAAMERDDAFGGLLRAIRDLEISDEGLPGLAEQVTDLKNKLPPALLAGTEPFDLSDPVLLRGCLEDVKEELIEGLLAGGSGQ
jgi:DNA repair exonuclease SbcCD nuclease subunit